MEKEFIEKYQGVKIYRNDDYGYFYYTTHTQINECTDLEQAKASIKDDLYEEKEHFFLAETDTPSLPEVPHQ